MNTKIAYHIKKSTSLMKSSRSKSSDRNDNVGLNLSCYGLMKIECLIQKIEDYLFKFMNIIKLQTC